MSPNLQIPDTPSAKPAGDTTDDKHERADAALCDAEARIIELYAAIDKMPSDAQEEEAAPLRDQVYELEDVIRATPTETLTGAAVKLRRLVDPVVGMPTGSRETDFPTLRDILAVIERRAGTGVVAGADDPFVALWAERVAAADEYAAVGSVYGSSVPGSDGYEELDKANTAAGRRVQAIDEEIANRPATTPFGLVTKLRICWEQEQIGAGLDLDADADLHVEHRLLKGAMEDAERLAEGCAS